jgi:hypothetical protein
VELVLDDLHRRPLEFGLMAGKCPAGGFLNSDC